MSRVCDIADAELHGFHPFNDSYQVQNTDIMAATYAYTRDGMDTAEVDPFRQGVEILTNRQRFVGMLPKIWSGNICGYTRINTYGQFENFVEYSGNTLFDDRLIKFDPVFYISASYEYPFPLIFNDGPQQKYEVALEPLTIIYRKNTNEIVSETAHTIRGMFEIDGFSATQLEQYYYPQPEGCNWFFLDMGDRHVGYGALSSSLPVQGYVSKDVSCIKPFDDTIANGPQNPMIKQLRTTNSTLINLLMSSSMDVNLDNDIREEYGYRSKSAGYDVYGPDAKRYGTDSIAFIGLTRGA